MLQQEVVKPQGSVSVYPTVRNEVDDAELASVNTIAPLNEQTGDAETELLEDGTEKKKEEEKKADESAKAAEKVDEKVASTEKKKDEVVLEKKVAPVSDKKDKDAIQKRIDELTRKRYDAERRADAERSKRIELENELQKLKAPESLKAKPKAEDFSSEAEYNEALIDWKVEAKAKESRETAINQEKTASANVELEAEKSVVVAVIDKGKEKYTDFTDKVFNKELVLSPVVVKTVMAADNAEDILYYIASNPEESKELSAMNVAKLAIAIGKISAKVEQPAVAATPPVEPVDKGKKTTNAPPPIVPLKTTGATEKDPSQMTPKEYRAWRERNKE